MWNLISGKTNALIVIVVAVAVLLLILVFSRYEPAKPAIRVGVLHSLTGTMSASEAPLVDALRLALEETNQEGGIGGAQVEMIVADCRSDAGYCAQQARKLITEDRVEVLFGCWTSACRKAVKAEVEQHRHLLFYPLQYEGLEQSSDIIYTGAAPNQQLIPMVTWAMQHHGRRAYLIGSDYVFPHTANQIVKKLLRARGGELAGEHYVPLGGQGMDTVVREIIRQHPDFIVNTLNGDSNRNFFEALQKANISAADIPVFSTSIAEAELAMIGPELVSGHYAAWNYFQSIDSDENRAFIERFRQRFGAQRVLNDPMESSYIGFRLWVGAMRSVNKREMADLKNVLQRQTLAAPEGIVSVDAHNNHLWKPVRIGRARADGQFDIVWQSGRSIAPAPFPFFISPDQLRVMTEGRP